MKINEFFSTLSNRPETAMFIDELCRMFPNVKELTVRRWVNRIQKPPVEVQEEIAKIVSERLGREITPEELFKK